jgi:hypothetical protein
MNEHYYLYAIAGADCPLPPLGPGVDDRFPVESLPHGQVAGLASRVGLDRFDLAKLQEGTADAKWLSDVAVRHNAIVSEAAASGPVLPLRLGVLFQSRDSLLAKLARHGHRVAEFLRFLGDRREWAVKVYLDQPRAERGLVPAGPSAEEPADRDERAGTAPGQGALYLASRRLKRARESLLQAAVRCEVAAVRDSVQGLADAWCQLRPLPQALLDRGGKMIFNGAFLLARPRERPFQTLCGRLRGDLAPKGLLLEATGPWPAYHFCPALDPDGDSGAAADSGH